MIDIKAIRARCAAATKGPWEAAPFARHESEYPMHRWRVFLRGHSNPQTNSRDCDWNEHEARFIAAARTDVEQLCDEVERLAGERDRGRVEVGRLRKDLRASNEVRDGALRDVTTLSAEIERLRDADVTRAQLAVVTKERDEARRTLTSIAATMSCEPDDDADLVEAVRWLVKERDEARAAGVFRWRHKVEHETVESIAILISERVAELKDNGLSTGHLVELLSDIRAGEWRAK